MPGIAALGSLDRGVPPALNERLTSVRIVSGFERGRTQASCVLALGPGVRVRPFDGSCPHRTPIATRTLCCATPSPLDRRCPRPHPEF
jgi:hypothetical protein